MVKECKPPKRDKKDVAHIVTKAVIAAIPMVGGSAAEIFESIVQPPIEKRRDAWMEGVSEILKKLENNKKINLEELKTNEEFIDVVINTTKLAITTSKKEKLDALHSALINVSIQKSPYNPEIFYFLRLIDDLTEWHIRILKILHNPSAYCKQKGEFDVQDTVEDMINRQYPELNKELTNQMVNALYRYGLSSINQDKLEQHGSIFAKPGNYTTDLGGQFIKFISTTDI